MGWCILVLLVGTSLIPSIDGIMEVRNPITNDLYTDDPPSIVYVDDDYNETTPGWGYDHFNTIESGIDTVTEGGTVYVYAGYYDEYFHIYKTINLIGQGRNKTIISDKAMCYDSVILITANQVHIHGFTIKQRTWGLWYEQVINIFSNYNDISGNRIEFGRDRCILLQGSNNRITGNIIGDTYGPGIYTGGTTASNNIIVGNTFYNSGSGLSMHYAATGAIYHNNFINNYQPVYDDGGSFSWDNGYPSGGNYWDTYDELVEGAYDFYSGPDQDILGSDGVADNPYLLPGTSIYTPYPLMNPWTPICGDVNLDEVIDGGDVVCLISYLFRHGAPPIPDICVGDVNGDGQVNASDIIYLIDYLFRNGPPPASGCCDH
jgi:hypothetical protein